MNGIVWEMLGNEIIDIDQIAIPTARAVTSTPLHTLQPCSMLTHHTIADLINDKIKREI